MASDAAPRGRFGRAILAALLGGRLRFPGGHRPPAGHVVGEAFAGVGVAASDDPAVDEFIVAQLRWAGLNHVRVDFTASDENGPAARLLDRLIAAGVRVTLHPMQARDEAKQMPGADAASRWQAFLTRTLDRYGADVEMVELGSTVNRQRWCGHSLAGFLAMWAIGWQEVRARGLTLAGPGVTDFEPPWNVGLLSLLAERGQLPDLHSDNLFSERCTEPERFDHKILGRRLVGLHKFNLIKKARLLARLGADAGVPRLISPAAFWTLPRIERMLPDSEQKQADYLSRYMVLCAASGALECAWWGPLICHREGLVDNGERPYPALERITRYASVEGGLGDLRVRPALHALRAFAGLVPGARYEGRLNSSEGLEVHAFRTAERLLHVVWTINGRAAALDDLYAPEDVAAAEFRDRDGEPEPPGDAPRMLLGESPRYLSWPAGREVAVKAGAALLPDLVIARHAPGLKYFLFREGNWQGVIAAASAQEADVLLQSIHPERLAAPSREASLRHARNAIWAIPDPRRGDARLVIKQPVTMHLHKRLFDRFKPSKALRSWNGTNELLRRGVAAAAPVACFEWRGDRTLMRNFYVCEHVPAEWTAREMVAAFSGGAPLFAGVSEPDAYRQLAAYLLRMHGGGILFRDLSGGNILIGNPEPGQLSFALIDTGRIRVFPVPLALGQRFDDLVRICNKLHPAGREQFLRIYLAAIRSRPRFWHRLPFLLYDFKVWAKRRFGRKAIKKLFGRR
ncbi:MAG: hypothetical protein E6R10_09365 [Rhodocyclaceae bacterium]|nr:MAG: hypothetical protein E6R10_09365 [Rhodocyclaceae bacterium]